MSGSRGRAKRGGANNLDFSHNYSTPRWQNQQPFVNPIPQQGSWNEDSWAWSQMNEGWNQNTHEQWSQQQHFRGRGGHHFGQGFSQYRQQQNYNPHYQGRTGIHSEHGSGTTRGANHQSFPQRGAEFSQRGLQFPSTSNGQSRSGETVENHSSVSPASKPPSTETSTTFRPPNVDLTNKVKEKLKQFQASKEQNSATPSKTVSLNRIEPVTSSSPSTARTRASRVSGDTVAVATSPSTTTVARIANKSPASSSAVSSVEPDSVLEGIGFIQRTSSAASVEFPDDRSKSATPEEDEPAGELLVTISKEAMNSYIKKMDNQQRRQLIEQPRGSLPQYMLDHLIQENHLAQSRQLSSLRFLRFSDHSGSSSNSDMDTSSKTDDHLIVPQDFLQQVKDLLENDESPTTDPLPTGVKVLQKICVEDDEIELLEAPVKEPPPCIDLDLEDSTDGPTSTPLSSSSFVSTVKVIPIPEERHVLEESLTNSLIPYETSDLPEAECERVITGETGLRFVNSTTQVVEKPSQVIVEEPRNSSQVEPVPSTSSDSLNLLVLNLQIEENSENMRVAEIDRKIEELQRERKLVLERVMALKQKQIDAYRSVMANRLADSSLLPLDGKPETTSNKSVKAPVSASCSDVNVQQRPPQLISLMQQLEDNGVDVAFGESSSKQSGSNKRKRVSNDTGERLNKKTLSSKSTESSGPSTVAAGSSKPIPIATSLVDSSQVCSSIESHVPKDSIAMPSLPSSSTEPKKGKNLKKKEKSVQKSTTGPATESKKLKKKNKEKKSPNEKTGKKKKSLKNKSSVKKATEDTTSKPPNYNAPSVSAAVIPQSVPVAPHPNQTVDTPATAPGNRLTTPSVAAAVNQNVFKGLSMTSMKDPHDKGVRCMFVVGSVLFTASEDGTVLVHDVDTGIRAMRLIGHEEPITWLYAVMVRSPVNSLLSATVATCLDHLDLVTGSLDGCIRQFTMKTGECRAETPCVKAVSCVTGDNRSGKLYIGSVDGTIYSYNPKAITVDKVKYKVDREILCLKVGTYKNNRVLIISAKHKDPLVYNLITDEMVLSLISNTPNLSISCISFSGNSIFCCDASKKVFTFDWTNERPLQQVDSISSSAVSSYFWRERFLLLGCIDGTIRVMDTLGKPPTKTFALPTHQLKALGCMKVVGGKVICGTQTGEVVYFSLAEVETIIKTVFRAF